MKHLIPFLFPSLFCLVANGQNLVPNPSFEEYNSCPNADAQFDRVNHWTSFGNSPDYQNSCDFSNQASVPENIWGFQEPYSGEAYVGVHAFTLGGNQQTSLREYVGIELLSQLEIGTKYFFSMQISPTLVGEPPFSSVKYTNNKMGAFFTTYGTSQLSIPNFAHVYTDSIVSDTLQWFTVNGSFEADSSYTHIVIGNFFDDTQTEYSNVNPDGEFHLSYYYVDDVCLSTDSLLCVVPNSVGHLREESIRIYPNPAHNHINVSGLLSRNSYTVKIIDLGGKTLSEIELIGNDSDYRLNLNTLVEGYYWVRIQSASSEVTFPIVITNP
jgi:hypothetical protein